MVQVDRVFRDTAHRVSIALLDAADVISYERGTSIRPTYLTILWKYVRPDGWVLTGCQVSGMNIRMDGSTGLRGSQSDFVKGSGFRNGTELADDTPDWVRSLVYEYEPHGDVLIP